MNRTAAPTTLAHDTPRSTAWHRRPRRAALPLVAVVLSTLLAASGGAQQATVRVTGTGTPIVLEHDDTVVTESCVIMIPAGTVIEDRNGDGVVQVAADGITVSFTEASLLRGAAPGVLPDAYAGLGVVVDGHRDVTLRGLAVSGFQTAVLARDADGLTVEDCSLTDNRRQRLRSTAAAADDGSDWLAPHANDEQQWRRRYGAALCIEDSAGVSVRNLYVRDSQNGVILDRVVDSEVLGCDLSFLSGWGLALWRSSRNVIGRNALDFCVRGYSHGVYNRGQDSAGLLMFEQCHDNLIAENSITHGGDGIFAFAGSEALGEGLADDDGLDRRGIGHHGNAFVGNDLSDAAAHGLELTFADSNLIRDNTFAGNAICGIWGGYSRGLTITGNSFLANGDAGYGAERGGVNIEHGRDNAVVANLFGENACGVHLWWDEDPHLVDLPWSRANGTGCAGNAVVGNLFLNDTVAIELRACEPTRVAGNQFREVGETLRAAPGAIATDAAATDGHELPEAELSEAHHAQRTALRGRSPRGARPHLAGREHIIMGEWGPWDHQGSLLRQGARAADHHRVDILGRPDGAEVRCSGEGLTFATEDTVARIPAPPGAPPSYRLDLSADIRSEPDTPGGRPDRVSADPDASSYRLDTAVTIRPAPGARGVLPYRVAVDGVGALEGQFIAATWDLTVFPWTVDPREDVVAWRAEAGGPEAVRTTVPTLHLPYGGGGPSQLDLGAAVRAADLPGDRFGTLATTRLPLPAGTWRLTTVSDDGVRVSADGRPVIDNWTWHAPTTDTGTFEVRADGEVVLAVEHFELDGWATLELRLTREE